MAKVTKANMPARNSIKGGFKLGSGMKGSQIASPKAAPGKANRAGKHNLPTKNKASLNVPMGTTKHAPGTVPGYLKRSK